MTESQSLALIGSALILLVGLFSFFFPNLIAGYNTMSKEEKKKYDIKGIKRMMLITCTISAVLIFIAGFFTPWINWLFPIIVIGMCVYIIVSANSKRFKAKMDN